MVTIHKGTKRVSIKPSCNFGNQGGGEGFFQVLPGGDEQFFWGPRGGGEGFFKAQMESPERAFSILIAWSLTELWLF